MVPLPGGYGTLGVLGVAEALTHRDDCRKATFAKPENRLRFYAEAERFLAKHRGGRYKP